LEHEEATVKLLKIIQDNPEISQRNLAKTIGISVDKTNYIIKALVDKGIIKYSDF